MKVLFTFILFIYVSLVFSQSHRKIHQPKNRQLSWIYANLDKEIKGTIVFYDQPGVACGIVSTESVALIKLSESDTIRILGLCDVTADKIHDKFMPGDMVSVTPDKRPSFYIDILPVDPKTWIIKRTYFGTIKKIK